MGQIIRRRMTGRLRQALGHAASGFAGLLLVMASGAAGAADGFACKAMRFVAPNPPGGATDVLSRMLAPPLAQRLGIPVTVENRGGASTNIGNEFVARAAPDGCTLLLGNISMALNKSLFKLTYDPETDLRAVIQVAAVPIAMFVNPKVSASSFDELIALARASPGKITFSSAGNGTPTHLLVEMINDRAQTKIVHVPYRGAGPSTMDVITGQVSASADSLIPVVPHIRNGNLRAIGITGRSRSPALPEVPTFAEQGVDYVDLSLWYGVMAPGRTPDDVVERLNRELSAVLATPEVEARLTSLGSTNPRGTPQAFQKLLHDETVRLGEVIRKAGIVADQ
ncbi:MAG TPA: tripartite tricarboxylate transporter substrate binding protein [Burkholderiaceae bacterium]|nr:tripartite tricarboxylate transporter substrate binding protein [Burkholderiaceae bacterium]